MLERVRDTALLCSARGEPGWSWAGVTAGSRGKLCLQLHEHVAVLFLLCLLPAPRHVPTARSPLGRGRFCTAESYRVFLQGDFVRCRALLLWECSHITALVQNKSEVRSPLSQLPALTALWQSLWPGFLWGDTQPNCVLWPLWIPSCWKPTILCPNQALKPG